MQRLFVILPEIARSPSTVLILGESGTGKELVARALYNASERKDKPFIIVNCAALPETLLESELFGYKAGAFTDARKDKIGRFAAAEGGTLFLDEIGDIPAAFRSSCCVFCRKRCMNRLVPTPLSRPMFASSPPPTATSRPWCRRELPQRPLLPPQRGQNQPAASAGAQGRHPPAHRAFHQKIQCPAGQGHRRHFQRRPGHPHAL
jgi:hypothetical protein